MDFSLRRQTNSGTSFWFDDFRPYRRPPLQQFHQLPVFMVYAPVPTRDFYRTFVKDVRKHFGRSKSSATKARDKSRKQKFIENKSVCSGFPFFRLDNVDFQKEIVYQVGSREIKLESKVKSAAESIKKLRAEIQTLRPANNEFQRSLSEQTKPNKVLDPKLRNKEHNEIHVWKLHEDLEFEKERVFKLVTQNLEREREIRTLKETLMNSEKSVGDFQKRFINRLVELDKENQNFRRFIDNLPRKWKDKL